MSTISAGTPGRQKTRHAIAQRAGTSRSMPGAVPCGLRITRLPAGNMDCSSFCGGMGRFRRANSRRMCSKASPSSTQPRGRWPRANASRVRSSAVGPSPPVATTRSARPIARRNASAHGFQLVAHRGMEQHANAQFLQPLAEPPGVRVEKSAAGDLVTDGQDFGVHETWKSRRGFAYLVSVIPFRYQPSASLVACRPAVPR